jgi:hypothetical protein
MPNLYEKRTMLIRLKNPLFSESPTDLPKTPKNRRSQMSYRRFLLSGWTDLVVFLIVVF